MNENPLNDEYKMFYPIYSVNFKGNKKITIGDYTFYPPNLEPEEYSDTDYENYDLMINDFIDFIDSPIISITVKSSDRYYAEILALEKLSILDDLINVLSKRYDYQNIGIINVKNCKDELSYIFNKKGIISHHSRYTRIIDSDFKKLLDSELIIRLLEISSKECPTEIEKRIIQSARWIGLANKTGYTPMSFICYMIAIESSISHNKKNELTSSTSSQLRDFIAYILGNDLNSRLEFHKTFTRLYELRSKAVHGSSSDITRDDYEKIYSISLELIKSLLTDKKFNKLESMDDLYNYIKNQKYSFVDTE